MGILKGYKGSVKTGTDVVGEMKNFSINTSNDIVDTTVLGDEWAANETTIKRWTASAQVLLDVSNAGQGAVEDALIAGTDLALVFYVGGATGVGNRSYTGAGKVATMNIVNEVAGIVTVDISITGNGALTPADLA